MRQEPFKLEHSATLFAELMRMKGYLATVLPPERPGARWIVQYAGG